MATNLNKFYEVGLCERTRAMILREGDPFSCYTFGVNISVYHTAVDCNKKGSR